MNAMDAIYASLNQKLDAHIKSLNAPLNMDPELENRLNQMADAAFLGTKKCAKCTKQLPLTDFYKHNGQQLMAKCKKCYSAEQNHRQVNHVYKPRGFSSLRPDQQKYIMDRINTRLSIRQIADGCGVTYKNLAYWARKGSIPGMVRAQ